jgi:hypothetical protein
METLNFAGAWKEDQSRTHIGHGNRSANDRFPLLIGAPSRFPRTELARLTPKSDLEKYRRAANLPVEGRKLASVETTEDAVLPALQEAGATGLQPAKDTALKFGADERALGGSSAPVPCEADAVARRPVILPVDPSPE